MNTFNTNTNTLHRYIKFPFEMEMPKEFDQQFDDNKVIEIKSGSIDSRLGKRIRDPVTVITFSSTALSAAGSSAAGASCAYDGAAVNNARLIAEPAINK